MYTVIVYMYPRGRIKILRHHPPISSRGCKKVILYTRLLRRVYIPHSLVCSKGNFFFVFNYTQELTLQMCGGGGKGARDSIVCIGGGFFSSNSERARGGGFCVQRQRWRRRIQYKNLYYFSSLKQRSTSIEIVHMR